VKKFESHLCTIQGIQQFLPPPQKKNCMCGAVRDITLYTVPVNAMQTL